MSTTQPIPVKPPAQLPPSADGTLTPTPHIIAVAAGMFTGWLTTLLHLSPDYAPYVTLGVATLMTTGVHFLQAKLDE